MELGFSLLGFGKVIFILWTDSKSAQTFSTGKKPLHGPYYLKELVMFDKLINLSNYVTSNRATVKKE